MLRVLAAAGVTVVAEAAFQDTLWRQGLEPLAELVDLRIIHCEVEEGAARQRLTRLRSAHGDRSPAVLEALAGGRPFADFDRISIPAPSIVVDTTEGYSPPLSEVVAFVSRK